MHLVHYSWRLKTEDSQELQKKLRKTGISQNTKCHRDSKQEQIQLYYLENPIQAVNWSSYLTNIFPPSKNNAFPHKINL